MEITNEIVNRMVSIRKMSILDPECYFLVCQEQKVFTIRYEDICRAPAKSTEFYMQKVVDNWLYSCEHFLSNVSMNRVAWLGQAACCLCHKVPNLVTMYYWKFLDAETQDIANKIAETIIHQWEQKIKYKNTSSNGSKRDTQTGYQMRLLLSSKKED